MYFFAWKNVEAFRRHVKDMETFRSTHKRPPLAKLAGLVAKAPKTTGTLAKKPRASTARAGLFASTNGKKIIVPIWDITMPKGSQN
jgi:hypothetical protein